MRNFKPLILTVLLSATLGLTSCGSGQKKTTSGADAASQVEMGANNEGMTLELNADSDSGKAGMLKTVYFDFNSSTLTGDTRAQLEANAEFLKNNTSVEVQVEGHCDERGGVQYNLALGERRAQAVKNYLVSMGISSSRITTISFGKMRPVAFGHNEESWSQNRRGNFVVTAK